MPRSLFFRDNDGVVHETGGHYGAQSMMACELSKRFKDGELRSVEGPATCLECIRAMTYTKWG